MAAEKRRISPIVSVAHNEADSGFTIDVDIPGVAKESVDLEMGTSGFCVKAAGEDFRYEACYMLPHDVRPGDAKAEFTSGLLKIEVPFKDGTKGTKVVIR